MNIIIPPLPEGGGGILFYYTPTPQRGRGVYCFKKEKKFDYHKYFIKINDKLINILQI
jgi:hypothetical protein